MAASSRGPMYKIVLLGELGVGKTSIFRRLKDDEFDETVTTTTGIDSCTRPVTINGQTVTLSVWDTAGVERFRTLTRNYYRGAHATVFVYSVDEPSSLHYLTSWVRDAESFASTAVKFLVGNKVDLDNHDIDSATAESFASNHDFVEMFTTSAKTGEGLEHAFTQIATKLHNSMGGKTSASPSSIDLAEDNLPKKMGCCC
eukprot:scpid71683/ scgid12651/ Ras-related protein Rab-18-B